MTWLKIDDKFHSHPKAVEAKLESIGLWTLAGSHCADYATDGFVSTEIATRLAGSSAIAKRAAANLVEVRLWHVVDGGWQFHDWADYQPIVEEVTTRLNSISEKRRVAGRLGAQKRWQTPIDANGKTDNKPMAIAIDQNGNGMPPIPIPIPIQDPPLPPDGNPGSGIDDEDHEHESLPPEAHAAIREDAETERGTSTPLRQGGAAFEVATTAFAEAVGAVTGSGYGFTPLTRIHFVGAVNAHAPAGLHGRELEQRIRFSATRFASARHANGHPISIQAWLDWLNSGNGWTLTKARPVAVAKARSSAPPPEAPPMSLADMGAMATATLLEIDRRSGGAAMAPLGEGGHGDASL